MGQTKPEGGFATFDVANSDYELDIMRKAGEIAGATVVEVLPSESWIDDEGVVAAYTDAAMGRAFSDPAVSEVINRLHLTEDQLRTYYEKHARGRAYAVKLLFATEKPNSEREFYDLLKPFHLFETKTERIVPDPALYENGIPLLASWSGDIEALVLSRIGGKKEPQSQ